MFLAKAKVNIAPFTVQCIYRYLHTVMLNCCFSPFSCCWSSSSRLPSFDHRGGICRLSDRGPRSFRGRGRRRGLTPWDNSDWRQSPMGQGGRGKPPEGGGQGGHGADPRHSLRAQVRAPQHRNVQPHLWGNVHVIVHCAV
jgi:hypothetical protein